MLCEENDTLTPAEAAELLRRSVVTLERWRRVRIGPPHYKIAGRVLYSRHDIAAWLQTQRVAA
ncbi:helix-turn-helix domain-containing protein [Dokdonella immobilis]|uniref:Helix-turn-helix domain-containing protein n=1 Tax=Dokdonella immobilis TaxID=578942 RepID=A0A1I4ZUM4_9GAMM|nr:helix-turn-helix domain-containing protein [Dokdonella immobilis]SFN53888.1 Helix-turn-helix domain-containing protein [Dokdonella immobilis]